MTAFRMSKQKYVKIEDSWIIHKKSLKIFFSSKKFKKLRLIDIDVFVSKAIEKKLHISVTEMSGHPRGALTTLVL